MTNEPEPAKITAEFCFFKQETGESCNCAPKWALASEKTAFRVCDEHLAWGIRLSGAPARVDEYKKKERKEETGRHDLESIEGSRRSRKKTNQLMVIKKPDTMKREEEGGRSTISERPFAKPDV
jgi:hypothetical protein